MKTVLVATLVMVLASCSAPEVPIEVCGDLVFASGYYGVRQIRFPQNNQTTIVDAPDQLWVNSVAADGLGGIFFTAGWPCEEPYVIYHLENGASQPVRIREGMLVAFSPSSDMLYYYFDQADVVAKSSLYVLELGPGAEPFRIGDAPKGMVGKNGMDEDLVWPPIVEPSGGIFFLGSDYRVKKFDSSTLKVSETGIDGCLPRGYRPSSDSLLCSDWNSRDLYEVEIASANRRRIKSGIGAWVLYVPELDSILFTEIEMRLSAHPRGEVSIIWLHSLKSKNDYRLGEGRFKHGFWANCITTE